MSAQLLQRIHCCWGDSLLLGTEYVLEAVAMQFGLPYLHPDGPAVEPAVAWFNSATHIFDWRAGKTALQIHRSFGLPAGSPYPYQHTWLTVSAIGSGLTPEIGIQFGLGTWWGNACYAKAFPIWSGIGSYCTGSGVVPYNGTVAANGTTWTLDIDNFQEVPWSCSVTAIGRTV